MILYSTTLSPLCRTAQLMLAEAKHPFVLSTEKPWEKTPPSLSINPSMLLPVLELAHGQQWIGFYPISEQFSGKLLEGDDQHKGEIRRLVAWFNGPLWEEVVRAILFEKKEKIFLRTDQGGGPPDLNILRHAMERLCDHLDYISYLVEIRNWLAGEHLSLADIAAAAQISCVDYFCIIPWDRFPLAKTWYARIKSRPSFQPILKERLSQIPPSKIYADLDF